MAFLLVAVGAGAAAVAVGASVAAAVAVGVATAAIYDHYMDSMMPDDIAVDTMSGRIVTKKDSTASRKLVYGEVRVGGTIVYQDNSGEDNKYLHTVVAFCDGEVDEIKSIWLDDSLAYGLHEDTHKYFGKYSIIEDGTPNATAGKLFVRLQRGTFYNGAVVASDTAGWTAGDTNAPQTGHNLSGIAYAYIRMEYSDEIFTNGFPKISAIIRGKQHYDPREDDDATEYNGSGNHLVQFPHTWEYSNNSAICLLNYMMDKKFGLGESLDAFDATSLLASIQDCESNIFGANNVYTNTTFNLITDTRKQFIPGRRYRITNVGTDVDWASIGAGEDPQVNDIFTATGSGIYIGDGGRAQHVEYKYTCDGIIDAKNSHKSNIQNILTTMNGQLLYSNGKYHIKSYKWETPHTQTIDESMIIGNITFATKTSRRNLYNRVKGNFIDRFNYKYSRTEYATQRYINSNGDAEWEDLDGEVLTHQYNLPMTVVGWCAQRLAKLILNKSRLQETIKFTLNAKGLTYTVGDNVKISNSIIGYDEKIFQIQRLNIRSDVENGLTVDIEAKENIESYYDWTADELTTEQPEVTVSLFDGVVNAPTDLQLESYVENAKSKLRASWTPAENQGTIVYKLYYQEVNSTTRVAHPATTYDSFIEVDLKDYLQGKNLSVFVQAQNQGTGSVSRTRSGFIRSAKVIKENPNFIVRGDVADPSISLITSLCANAGIPVDAGREVTYLQVDENNNVLNSIDYQFETMTLSPITIKVNNDVVGAQFGNLIADPYFVSALQWGNVGSEFTHDDVNEVMTYESAGQISGIYQVLNDIVIGKRYSGSFNISNYSDNTSSGAGEPFLVFRVCDFLSAEGGTTLVADDINVNDVGNGTHTFDFIAPTDTLLLMFVSISPAGVSCDIDNVILERDDEKAEHKLAFLLPPSVQDDVTWTYSYEQDNHTQTFTSENSIGIVDVTGVSTSFTGFDDTLKINNRKYVEVGLERESSAQGFSQCEITVTASWSQTINILGETVNIPKTATSTVALSARVR